MVFRTVLDLVFPRACNSCHGTVGEEGDYFCWDCLSELLLIRPPLCSLCGNPVEGRVDRDFVCFVCADRITWFNRARSAARFDGGVRSLIHDFKYHQAVWLRRDLARLLQVCLQADPELGEVDAICYVPLHHVKQRQRGFNQAALLAASLASATGRRCFPKLLARVRPTQTQTNLTAPQRAANVQDAFRVRWPGWVRGRRLLLVDDVMTTGATVNECARALKGAGAAAVYVVTVARG
jgi:ComF family protein